ncbi:U6 snRNA-associated-like-Smprotein LSm6 (macronuclear) [Tetrahymena thermophila SB210]|uniref:U6 snRNA-associated-like-Smprotein LSm6 n=1 Tax=Tetrahymena thermophila (strain SB210) TaxID=312017 RepID=W7XJD3_TETTS|nr:U6 snRNA-associated-like-Smprotein LSm6 [Tetrahymena thermophila SB210]EWS74059.1 U6 snRNA-associated-like-Smprotein LSm6 [Tetrahymena thermophila SB210]|eukprot:XP_012653392.1 U6 snRNA-associated-like-Smprotein LSm6 [Tetrahymena thermophila SB210]
MSSAVKRNPTDFLKQIMGRLVSVKLHNGTEYVGVLATFDGLMNVVLQQAEEFENSESKNKYSEIFIRGNNVLYLQQKKNKK